MAVWVLHSEDALTFLFLALIAPAVLCAPLWGRLARRIGKERGFLLASTLFAIAAREPARDAVGARRRGCTCRSRSPAPPTRACSRCPMAMLPDVISHDAGAHGDGRAGSFGGVWTAGETAGMALGATLLTVVLAVTGYIESTGSTVVVQPGAAVAGIVVSFSLLPAVLVLLSLVPLGRYPLRRGDIEADAAAEAVAR